MAMLVLCTMGIYGAFSVSSSYVMELLGAERAVGGAIMNSIGNLGGFVVSRWFFVCSVARALARARPAFFLSSLAGAHAHAHTQNPVRASAPPPQKKLTILFQGPYAIGALKDRHGSYHHAMYLMGSGLVIAALVVAAFNPAWAHAKALPNSERAAEAIAQGEAEAGIAAPAGSSSAAAKPIAK